MGIKTDYNSRPESVYSSSSDMNGLSVMVFHPGTSSGDGV